MARPYRLPRSIQELVRWYERYFSPLSILAGFLIDNLVLLKQVDVAQTQIVLGVHLFLAAAGIAIFHLIESGKVRAPWIVKLTPAAPMIAQFAFGGLFSAYITLYSRSAEFALSWIFVALLVLLLLFNERFSLFYRRFPVQIGIFFFALFSFFQFFLPIVFHQIGPWMFVASGFVSLAIVLILLGLLWLVVRDVVRAEWKRAFIAIAIVFVAFNLLYFGNALPPLPLALKQGGVYHSVMPDSAGNYDLSGEALPWYEAFLNYNIVYHATPGEPVYVWSEVYAPSGLSTEILHQWQYYDASTKKWETTNTVSFPIEGGRDGGYRGYSESFNPAPGKWRVNVITQYGELIGRISFTVVDVATPVPLVETTE